MKTRMFGIGVSLLLVFGVVALAATEVAAAGCCPCPLCP